MHRQRLAWSKHNYNPPSAELLLWQGWQSKIAGLLPQIECWFLTLTRTGALLPMEDVNGAFTRLLSLCILYSSR